MREELGKDVTLLTIAHRLQTIMDADKIVSRTCSTCSTAIFTFTSLDGAGCWSYRKSRNHLTLEPCSFQSIQVEFGKPSELLENKKGFLRSLVDASGDKEKLYTMAGADVPLKDRLSKPLHAIGV